MFGEDRRDCVRLALLHRAGLLTAIRVPSEQEEAVRDLVRTRADLVDDRRRMMQRISALLQRHGRVWRAPRWTYQHRAWLDRQSFTEPALQAALRTYLAAVDARDAELAVLETQLRGCWASVDPLASMVAQLGSYRGIAELTGAPAHRPHPPRPPPSAVGRRPGRKGYGATPPASRLLRIACGDGPAGRPGLRRPLRPLGQEPRAMTQGRSPTGRGRYRYPGRRAATELIRPSRSGPAASKAPTPGSRTR